MSSQNFCCVFFVTVVQVIAGVGEMDLDYFLIGIQKISHSLSQKMGQMVSLAAPCDGVYGLLLRFSRNLEIPGI